MNRLAKVLFQDRYLWLLAVPAVVYYILFHYLPMYGLLIAFKDFSPFLGILRSPWAGLVWFEQFFTSIHFVRTVRNTLLLNFYGFFFNFTVPIIFALLLNEVHNSLFRRWVQTISYIPHFVSIVVVVGLINAMFNTENGLVNTVLARLGMEPVPFLILPGWFRPLYATRWAMVLPTAAAAWNIIITRTYLQSNIDDSIPESAKIDGANDLTIFFRIVVPVSSTIIAVNVLFYAVGHWNAYFPALIYLPDPDLHPLQMVLRRLLILPPEEEERMAFEAIAGVTRNRFVVIVVGTLPILAVYPFLQRYFIKGVMIGALTG